MVVGEGPGRKPLVWGKDPTTEPLGPPMISLSPLRLVEGWTVNSHVRPQ